MTDTAYVQAFDLMWELFDEPALLIDRDNTIVAANAVARRLGSREGEPWTGVSPAITGSEDWTNHVEHALTARTAVSEVILGRDGPVTAYWMPLPESIDLVVHFGIGIAAIMERHSTVIHAQARKIRHAL